MDICVRSSSPGTRSASPLFCTPPPSDMPADLTHYVDSDVISRSYKQGTTCVFERGITSNNEKTRQPQMRKQKGPRESGGLRSSAVQASLTLVDALPTKELARAHDDSLVDESPKTQSHVSNSRGRGQDLPALSSPNLPYHYPSLSQLTGFATSGDDGARQFLVQPRKKQTPSRQACKSKSLRKPKSEECVMNESCNNSKLEGGLHQRSLIQSMLSVDQSGRDLTFESTYSMNENKREVTRPKGSYNGAAQKNRKLPITKGGFVLSDDSEAEDFDAAAPDERDLQPSPTMSTLPIVSPPKPRSGTSTDRRALNTKQLNKSRLSKILGRHKNHFHQGTPKAVSSQKNQAATSLLPPSTPVNTSNQAGRSQAVATQIKVGQRVQPNVKSTMNPRTVFANGPGTSPAPGGACEKVAAQSPQRSTLQDARSGGLNKRLQQQQQMMRSSTTMSPRFTASSVSPNIFSSQHAKQPLRRPREPSLMAGGYKPPALGSTQERVLQDQIQGQKLDMKSALHKTASHPEALGSRSAQKRKIKDMSGDLSGNIPPPKKRSATSGGGQNVSVSKQEVIQASKRATNGDGSLPVIPSAIDAPIALSSNLTIRHESAPVTKASLRPELQDLMVEPLTTVTMKTSKSSRAASGLYPDDTRTLQASTTSEKIRPKDGHLFPAQSPALRDAYTPNITSQTAADATAVSANTRQDAATDQSTHQQQQTLSIGPVCETPSGHVSPQDGVQEPVRNIQDIELSPMSHSADAEPYFEYSVLERRWSDEQDEYDVKEVDVILRPFTDVNEANNQVEKLFQRAREEDMRHTQNTVGDWSSKRDEHGCVTCKASFAQFDNPYKEHFVKIWVQRDYVSKLANRTPRHLPRTSFISSIVYVLRLCKLVAPVEESDSDGDEEACSRLRIHHPLVRAEVYTTLHMANRAAHDQQLEISHERDPKNILTVKWQEQNLKHLNEYLRTLNAAKHGKEACWESKFHGYGIGGDQFELVVEQAGICGPRNL